MLTTESLISIISFAVAMFGFGYMFGSNSKTQKNNRLLPSMHGYF